jgi:hypothetical protein
MKTRVLPALRRTPAEATALEVPRPRRNQAGWVIFAVRTDSYIYDAMSSVRAGRPVSFGSAVCMCWSQGRCRTALDDRSALTQPRTRRNASRAPPSSNSRRGTSRRSAGSPCAPSAASSSTDARSAASGISERTGTGGKVHVDAAPVANFPLVAITGRMVRERSRGSAPSRSALRHPRPIVCSRCSRLASRARSAAATDAAMAGDHAKVTALRLIPSKSPESLGAPQRIRTSDLRLRRRSRRCANRIIAPRCMRVRGTDHSHRFAVIHGAPG